MWALEMRSKIFYLKSHMTLPSKARVMACSATFTAVPFNLGLGSTLPRSMYCT